MCSNLDGFGARRAQFVPRCPIVTAQESLPSGLQSKTGCPIQRPSSKCGGRDSQVRQFGMQPYKPNVAIAALPMQS